MKSVVEGIEVHDLVTLILTASDRLVEHMSDVPALKNEGTIRLAMDLQLLAGSIRPEGAEVVDND